MIQINNLQKITGQSIVLDIQSLTVEKGEVAALVGPAGSGKGALFDLLIGRTRPSAGTVRLADLDPADDHRSFSRQVGVLFHEDSLYMGRSPQANLDLICQLYGLPKSRTQEVLVEIGMADQAGAKLDSLPSGLQRRLAYGRAMLHHPQILLLFDPFTRCDEATIGQLGRLTRQNADNGAACLILADDTNHLEAICDAIYSLNQGHLSAVSHPGEVQQTSAPFKIPVRLEDKVSLVNPADILFAEAEGGHARLYTAQGRMKTQFTLSELEERLSRSGFFRAHRSYLVNLQHVKEVIPYTRNSFSLKLDDADNTMIPLSKSAASELRTLLGY